MLSLVLLAVVQILSLGVLLVALRLSARLVKSPRSTWKWSAVALCAWLGATILAFAVSAMRPPARMQDEIAMLLLQLAVMVAAFRIVFRVGVWRALGGTAMATIMMLLASVVAIIPFRMYVAEAFVAPTNSMAPTLLGYHLTAKCSKCGGAGIVPVMPGSRQPAGLHGICTECRSAFARDALGAEGSPDRFIVSKLLRPQRFDIVAIQEDGAVYIKRLVGLPGEEVFVAEGAPWVNGERVALPAELGGLQYEDRNMRGRPIEFGTRVEPVQLGADEYFLLGDFSLLSEDSRYNGPVSHEQLIGVVDVCYWPPARWRTFR